MGGGLSPESQKSITQARCLLFSGLESEYLQKKKTLETIQKVCSVKIREIEIEIHSNATVGNRYRAEKQKEDN
jgi:hypothetical protein